MPAYFLADVVEVLDEKRMEEYRRAVSATVERHGGRYLTVGGRAVRLEGDWLPVFPVLIEFPDMDEARRWYESAEYRDLKALRLGATRGHAVFIDGIVPEFLVR